LVAVGTVKIQEGRPTLSLVLFKLTEKMQNIIEEFVKMQNVDFVKVFLI